MLLSREAFYVVIILASLLYFYLWHCFLSGSAAVTQAKNRRSPHSERARKKQQKKPAYIYPSPKKNGRGSLSRIVGGAEASWLVRSSPDLAVRLGALAGDIVLCSWARRLTLTVPLSTQVYKWVPVTVNAGGNPAMD